MGRATPPEETPGTLAEGSRPGAPKTTLTASPEAARRLKEAQRAAELTNGQVEDELHVSKRTVGRWRSGELAPDLPTAQRLADLVRAPDLVELWLKPPAPANTSTPGRRRRPRLIAVALIGLVLTALVLGGLWAVNREDAPGAAGSDRPTSTEELPTSIVATLEVSVALTDGKVGNVISAWTQPSTDTGCDDSPCLADTEQSVPLTRGTEVGVSCVLTGQKIRNGEPGHPGHYADDRWLLIPGGQVGLETGEHAWVSNVWLARDDLENIKACPPGK